ncbi:ABC transporter ATP-binding protein [Aneurinibacillus migulanus]|uniref:Multidrug ABC transporter ATP-binding protein n=1 Tax=Aneurinibacillus migulanus TaxID=47500 RepID=A0A0D1Y0V4_ANEMI|nr:ABC transporter ATP-binding protein [Aneurinibacillus migulanus]KIV60101.1 multidrug ABC transporter ATP-binding protein [Aneurinibacillus migulanus]KON96782.1 multidrug ABC transporter ATP-binding protein [Aneurinibacillus migulanus]MED0893550.1 ABC transporter ATP-binding protein [Aneurinibacillus migulanus]MED1616348.1 ABC transporter ATP-binding protein [Aneurinibacillus migulanus]SDJ45659.1 putative ABC transport system ATP-binding protein [Aneurinibacillus migulanus]
MEVLKVNDLSKVYNSYKEAKEVAALNGITLRVKRGDFVGIMGPSGSGKTTLLNLLSGIDQCTSGEVFIEDKNITHLSKEEMALFRRHSVGYVFQDFNLLDSLTISENIALPLILDKVNPKTIGLKLKELTAFFEIEHIQNKYPYHISGGQKQRAAVARALINDPAIVFADEPTGNLDSKSSKNIMNTLKKINDERNSTVLMVSHDPFAASFCKRIIFIKDGAIKMEIVSSGDRKEFFDQILEAESMIGGEIQ